MAAVVVAVVAVVLVVVAVAVAVVLVVSILVHVYAALHSVLVIHTFKPRVLSQSYELAIRALIEFGKFQPSELPLHRNKLHLISLLPPNIQHSDLLSFVVPYLLVQSG